MRGKSLSWTFASFLVLPLTLGVANPAAVSGGAPPEAASDGTSTGKRIGNIISAAVSTAFPEVDKIIKAIWPNGTTKPKTPAQATQLLQNTKQNADANQKPNTDALHKAASNLAVFRNFVTDCGYASVQISKMQVALSAKSSEKPLTEEEKAQLTDLWNPTNTHLEDLTSATVGASIDAMDDDFLKSSLTTVREAIKNNSVNIADQIKSGRVGALQLSLAQLAPSVNGIAELTGLLIGDLANSLKAAGYSLSPNVARAPEIDRTGPRNRSDAVKLLNQVYQLKLQ
jgi:hypothetical protein